MWILTLTAQYIIKTQMGKLFDDLIKGIGDVVKRNDGRSVFLRLKRWRNGREQKKKLIPVGSSILNFILD